MTSIGLASIKLPMDKTILEFNIHIINDDVSLLPSLADMDRMNIFYNNLINQLVHRESGMNSKVERFCEHPFVRWNSLLQSFFTYTELKRLHKRFGNPHTDKLLNLLKLAELDNVDANTRSMLKDITRRCLPCQMYAQAIRRFKFSLRKDKYSKHTVSVDIFYKYSKPILLDVDE